MSVRERSDSSGRAGPPARDPLGRAVDRPVFWWSVGAIFLVNAGLSAAEDHWVLAVLQALTCLWAAVAGVMARLAPPPPGAEDAPYRRHRSPAAPSSEPPRVGWPRGGDGDGPGTAV